MGYGPEIITDPNDRLSPFAGNWVYEPGTVAFWILGKDFFSEINVDLTYQVEMEVFRPSDSPGADLTFGISNRPDLAPSFDLPNTPKDTWIPVIGLLDFPPTFDNDQREMYFRLFPADGTEYFDAQNISVRAYIPSKVQYLPIMGVG